MKLLCHRTAEGARYLLLGDLLGAGLTGDLALDGGLLVDLALVLGLLAGLGALVLGLGGEDALHDALLLNKEGAGDAILDLVVGEDSSVGAGDGLAVLGGGAELDVGESLGSSETLVAQNPGGVDTLGALVAALSDETVSGGADHLDAVATGSVVATTDVVHTGAASHDGLGTKFLLGGDGEIGGIRNELHIKQPCSTTVLREAHRQ